MHRFFRWRSSFFMAKSREEVIELVRDYIACVLPSELLKMPASSQNAIADATADLASAALTLRRDELRFKCDEDTSALMNEMSQTFTLASARLARLEDTQLPDPIAFD